MKRILILLPFLLLACQGALDGTIREKPNGIRVTNNNPGKWTHIRMELDTGFLLELDSLQAGQDTLLLYSDFRNTMGQRYSERGTRPQRLVIATSQGMMQKFW